LKHIIFAVALLTLPVGAGAEALPDTFSFTVFSAGHKTGTAVIRVTERSPRLVLESVTEVDLGNVISHIEARTVANPKTFIVEKVTWDRTRGDIIDSGEINLAGRGYTGWVEMEGMRTAQERTWKHEHYLTLEDYVFEHEVLIALAYIASGESMESCAMVFPSATTTASVALGFVSDAEVESNSGAAVCRRLEVSITGASPYSLFFSPKINLPVYMVFPAVGVEVFLDSFFGDEPISKWVPEKTDSLSSGD